jgi:hypothetical protein
MRPGGQQRRQRAHQRAEAAIRLQIARHERRHLVARRQHAPVRQHEAGGRVGADGAGIDALVRDLDQGAEDRGMGVALPRGRREAGIHRFQRQQQRGVPNPQAAAPVQADLGFRNVADIGFLRPVEHLAIRDDAGAGQHLAQEQAFAPAWVGDDQIGHKTVPRQFQAGARDRLAAPHGGFGAA